MAGTCQYCGFAGTNDAMEKHAGECPVMLKDNQPDDLDVYIFVGKPIESIRTTITIKNSDNE